MTSSIRPLSQVCSTIVAPGTILDYLLVLSISISVIYLNNVRNLHPQFVLVYCELHTNFDTFNNVRRTKADYKLDNKSVYFYRDTRFQHAVIIFDDESVKLHFDENLNHRELVRMYVCSNIRICNLTEDCVELELIEN